MGEFYLPLKNLRKRLAAAIGLVVMLTVLSFAVFSGSILTGSLQKGLNSLEERLGADIIVVPAEAASDSSLESILLQGVPGYFYMDRSYADRVRAAEGVGDVSEQYFLASAAAGCCSFSVQLYGFDPERDFSIQPWISRSYGEELRDGQVLAGSNINADPGGTVTFFDQPLEVAGKLDRTGTEMDNAVYMNFATIRQLMEASAERGYTRLAEKNPDDLISAVLIRVKDGYAVDQVYETLREQLPGAAVIRAGQMLSGTSDNLRHMAGLIRGLIAAVWVVIVLILIVVFTLLSNERRREFAVLRAAGASRSMMASMVLKEALLLSLPGGAAGILLGALAVFPFSRLIGSRMGLPYLSPGLGGVLLTALGTMLAVLAAGPLAAALSARRLSRVEIGRALREDG